MRRLALLLAVCTFGAAASAPVSAGRVMRTPQLTLLDRDPFVVRGKAFRPWERVRVTVAFERRLVRRITATAAGTFTVSFGHIGLRRCDAVSVQAVGAGGSRTTLKLPLPPFCLVE